MDGPAIDAVAGGDVGDLGARPALSHRKVALLNHGQLLQLHAEIPLGSVWAQVKIRSGRGRGTGGTQVPEPSSPRSRSRVAERDTGAGADVGQRCRNFTPDLRFLSVGRVKCRLMLDASCSADPLRAGRRLGPCGPPRPLPPTVLIRWFLLQTWIVVSSTKTSTSWAL